MSAANWGIRGGGAKYFFSWPKCPPSLGAGNGFLVLLFFKVLCSACDPLCCKNMCCASRFWTGGGEAGGSGSKSLPKGHESKC